MPARYLFLDEVDGYPGDIEGEGEPILLAERRSSTFQRRKVLLVSTPKIKGLSRIEHEYEASDQRRYFVPCPRVWGISGAQVRMSKHQVRGGDVAGLFARFSHCRQSARRVQGGGTV